VVASSPASAPVGSSTDQPSLPPSDEPSPAPTDFPAVEPSPSAGAGGLAECTGNSENRDFFAGVASAVDWPVYCAVLPGGWFVDAGRYRLARGGWMEMTYKGPSGARLELHEGSFCQDPSGCVPTGTDAGTAAFGDRDGTLVLADDGRLAVVVDRGSSPSWLAIGSGLDRDAFVKVIGRLVRLN
jgi:hypothetical protein